MVQNDVLDSAKLEGEIEGRVESRKESRSRLEENIANTRKFKQMGISADIIAKGTGLSAKEIEQL